MSDLNPKINVVERIAERRFVMSFLKAHWPAISAVAGAVITFMLPSLQAFESAHDKTVVGVLCSCLIAAYYAQSPVSRSK